MPKKNTAKKKTAKVAKKATKTKRAKYKPRQFSSTVVDGDDRAPSRAMLHAVGFRKDDFTRSQVGIASTWANVTPCNMHIDKLAREADAATCVGSQKGLVHLRIAQVKAKLCVEPKTFAVVAADLHVELGLVALASAGLGYDPLPIVDFAVRLLTKLANDFNGVVVEDSLLGVTASVVLSGDMAKQTN